jgi:hypothetical protein
MAPTGEGGSAPRMKGKGKTKTKRTLRGTMRKQKT